MKMLANKLKKHYNLKIDVNKIFRILSEHSIFSQIYNNTLGWNYNPKHSYCKQFELKQINKEKNIKDNIKANINIIINIIKKTYEVLFKNEHLFKKINNIILKVFKLDFNDLILNYIFLFDPG